MLISIIMPAYNAEQYIGQAVKSVLEQSHQTWELLVVNDGSTDGTENVLAKYRDDRIAILHQPNQGEAAARNAGLERTRGELICFLDADDALLPNHLEALAGQLLAHTELGGVYADGYYIDGQGNRLQTLSSRRRGPYEGDIFEEVVYGSDVFGPPVCVMLRASLVHRHRLRFDESIVIGTDWDFLTKCAEVATFGYLSLVTCLYRVHVSNISLRTSLERRALELAKCRINATKLRGFRACSERTHYNVYYDLLVVLLCGWPEQQSEIIASAGFRELRREVRASLLRQAAIRALVLGRNNRHIRSWISEARTLHPWAWRNALVFVVYAMSPRLLRQLLRRRYAGQLAPAGVEPFSDMRMQVSASR